MRSVASEQFVLVVAVLATGLASADGEIGGFSAVSDAGEAQPFGLNLNTNETIRSIGTSTPPVEMVVADYQPALADEIDELYDVLDKLIEANDVDRATRVLSRLRHLQTEEARRLYEQPHSIGPSPRAVAALRLEIMAALGVQDADTQT